MPRRVRVDVQSAELQRPGHALAVIREEKLRGVNADPEQEDHSTYAIDGDHLVSEGIPTSRPERLVRELIDTFPQRLEADTSSISLA